MKFNINTTNPRGRLGLRRKIPVDGPGSWINGLNEHYLKKWKLLFKKISTKKHAFSIVFLFILLF